MSFLLYELALNPDIQEKLAAEIKEHDVKNGGKFSLKSIQDMPYLDKVVSGKNILQLIITIMLLAIIFESDINFKLLRYELF